MPDSTTNNPNDNPNVTLSQVERAELKVLILWLKYAWKMQLQINSVFDMAELSVDHYKDSSQSTDPVFNVKLFISFFTHLQRKDWYIRKQLKQEVAALLHLPEVIALPNELGPESVDTASQTTMRSSDIGRLLELVGDYFHTMSFTIGSMRGYLTQIHRWESHETMCPKTVKHIQTMQTAGNLAVVHLNRGVNGFLNGLQDASSSFVVPLRQTVLGVGDAASI